MEDEPTTDKPKVESQQKVESNRGREYVQLAEKMEQVKNQMAKMERKYDELYQTVKEANKVRDEMPSKDSVSPDENRPLTEPTGKTGLKSARPSFASVTGSEWSHEDNPNSNPTPGPTANPNKPLDIEKMEDNPFM